MPWYSACIFWLPVDGGLSFGLYKMTVGLAGDNSPVNRPVSCPDYYRASNGDDATPLTPDACGGALTLEQGLPGQGERGL